jgi:hypothetical protein
MSGLTALRVIRYYVDWYGEGGIRTLGNTKRLTYVDFQSFTLPTTLKNIDVVLTFVLTFREDGLA